MVISTNALNPLPPSHIIPSKDEAWEARELKFHEENVKQINDLVRRMNAQAPAVVRRPLVTREAELERIRGDLLKSEVWAEVQRRAEESKLEQRAPSGRNVPFHFLGGEGLSSLGKATRRSMWTIARPVVSVIGKGRGGGYGSSDGSKEDMEHGTEKPDSQSHKGTGILVVAGVGIAAVTYLRRPVQNKSIYDDDMIPIHPPAKTTPNQPSHVVASSPAEPRHTPLSIVRIYIIEPFLTALRFFHLALLFGPVILTSPMLLIGGPDRRRKPGKPVAEDEDGWGAVWWYGFLVRQMERAGPTFIKLGQWAASRADLFPASLCEQMSKLHSNGDPHSLRHTKRVIEKAFRLKFDDIFEEFQEKPIGCGAIAQVSLSLLAPFLVLADGNRYTERD